MQPESENLRLPEILHVQLKALKRAEGNPREHDVEQIRLLQKSLARYGLAALPVVQKETLRILAGDGRVEAMLLAGHGDVVIPVVGVDLSDADATAYAIADNRLSDLSTWNIPQLQDLLKDLEATGLDMEFTGFTDEALEELASVEFLEEDPVKGDPDEAPPCPNEPRSRRGDLYLLGRHRLLCGDATEDADVDHLMDGKVADLVITDPPYGLAHKSRGKVLKSEGKGRILNDEMPEQELEAFLSLAFRNLARVTGKRAAFYIWYSWRYHRAFENAMNANGINGRAQIVWMKNVVAYGYSQYKWRHELCLFGAKENEVPLIFVDAHESAFYAFKKGESPFWQGDRSQTTVWQVSKEYNCLHPTQKPIELLRKALTNSSKPLHLVVDLFGGSGSTLMACEVMGRRCAMMELDPKYVDVVVQRWEALTGKKAHLIRDHVAGSAA